MCFLCGYRFKLGYSRTSVRELSLICWLVDQIRRDYIGPFTGVLLYTGFRFVVVYRADCWYYNIHMFNAHCSLYCEAFYRQCEKFRRLKCTSKPSHFPHILNMYDNKSIEHWTFSREMNFIKFWTLIKSSSSRTISGDYLERVWFLYFFTLWNEKMKKITLKVLGGNKFKSSGIDSFRLC